MLFAVSIFTILLHFSIAEKSSLTRTYEFPETQVQTSWPNTDNANLVYARCNSSHVPGSSKGCVVGVKLDAFENSTGISKECEVTFKPELPNALVKDSFLVKDFGKDKILLVWMEVHNASNTDNQIEWTILKTSVIHMFDSCRNFEVEVHKYKKTQKFNFNCLRPSVAIFKDTYELILEDAINQCTSRSECSPGYGIYKFDSRGRKLSGPEHWPRPPLENGTSFVAALSQPKEGYFVSTGNCTNVVLELMDKQSIDQENVELWRITSSEPNYEHYQVSLANEAVGLGYIYKNSSVGCWQADQGGKIHVQAQFTFRQPYKATLSNMYNLRNGGLLLAVIKYTNSYSHTHDDYHLMKVDSGGQLEMVKVHFDNKCTHDNSDAMVRMFENKKNQYCIVRLCQSKPHKPGRLETSVRCYSSDEFSKCADCL